MSCLVMRWIALRGGMERRLRDSESGSGSEYGGWGVLGDCGAEWWCGESGIWEENDGAEFVERNRLGLGKSVVKENAFLSLVEKWWLTFWRMVGD